MMYIYIKEYLGQHNVHLWERGCLGYDEGGELGIMWLSGISGWGIFPLGKLKTKLRDRLLIVWITSRITWATSKFIRKSSRIMFDVDNLENIKDCRNIIKDIWIILRISGRIYRTNFGTFLGLHGWEGKSVDDG